MDFLRLGLVFAVIVVALRRKVPVGVTLFAAGLLVALLFQVSVARLIEGYWQMVSSIRFLSLTGVIVFVTTLGQLLKSQGYLERLSGVFGGVWGGQKTAVMVLPAMVGLMPMPGGALLSAPLVGQAMADPKYSGEHRTATNYWFRHVVEFSWPIYPGLVLTEAITHVPMGQVAMSLLMIIIGYFMLVRRIDTGETRRAGFSKTTIGILGAVWPIGTAILIYGIFRWDLSVSVLISLILLILFTRPSRPELMVAVREGFSYRLVLMVFGILSFQAVRRHQFVSRAGDHVPSTTGTDHLYCLLHGWNLDRHDRRLCRPRIYAPGRIHL
jgi:integral membrane protein (TIGR00529 family)